MSAKAPYNFIPLNKKVVQSDFNIISAPHNKYYPEKLTGCIELEIQNKTCFYIRDTFSKQEVQFKKESETPYCNPDFFSPNERYSIPGSSLRGMIRVLTEIVSFGKFGFTDNTTLYYRSFTDKCKTLVGDYNSRIKYKDPETGKIVLNCNSGLLTKSGNRFSIIPADGYFSKIIDQNFYYDDNGILFIDYVPQEGLPSRMDYYRFRIADNTEVKISEKILHQENFKGEPNILNLLSLYEEIINLPNNLIIGYNKVDCQAVKKRYKYLPLFYSNTTHKFSAKYRRDSIGCLVRKDGNEYFMKKCDTPVFQDNERNDIKKQINKTITLNKIEQFYVKLSKNRYFVVSGHMPNKRRHYIIQCSDVSDKPRHAIDPEIIRSYSNDVQRRGPDIVALLKSNPGFRIPCFFTEDNDRISAIGQTPMLRIAYTKKINQHIPNFLTDENITDITEAIFGHQDKHSTRVFFEDAFLQPGFENHIQGEPVSPMILSSPKVTSFQHYLEQNNQNVQNLSHYNNSANIRGNKLYWHAQRSFKAEDKDIAAAPKQYTKIKPVNPGAKFFGRIRFENLSSIELGALLFVLKLKDTLMHKIGMGKSLGFGSIKIIPTLFLSNRKERYSSLLAEWNGLASEPDIKKFIDAFEKFILAQIGESEKKSLWDVSRIAELGHMLDFGNTTLHGWNDTTGYMDMKDFRAREVLPKPTDVKNHIDKGKP